MKLDILTEPNPILHQKCKPIKKFDKDLRDLVLAMIELLYANKGIGLAAPQVGKKIRLIVIEFDPTRFHDDETDTIDMLNIPLTVLINPKIIYKDKKNEIANESCLSLPTVDIPIKRSTNIKIMAQDIDGNRIKIKASDLFARILQHEIDHLDGILITNKNEKE